jgi:hypothetical protein
MSGFKNTKRDHFIDDFPTVSLDSLDNNLTTRCKFNFSYFDNTAPAQDFGQWDHNNLTKLLNKLKEYSCESLDHWKATPCKSGHILEIYKNFPSKSDFKLPRHIPIQAHWGRFRLERMVRLVGFILPDNKRDEAHPRTGLRFDCNTFYVVFLDANHQFYKTEKK